MAASSEFDYIQPQRRPQPTGGQQVKPIRRKYAKPVWSLMDKIWLGAALVTAVVMMCLVVYMSNQAAMSSEHLSKTTAQLSTVRNQNTDLKEEISQLTNPSRLDQVAKKYGLSLNNNNVRNVK